MTQVITSLKGDAARVFDWVRHNHHNTSDLGLIMEKICNHYCSTLMFREQRNMVENIFWLGSVMQSKSLIRIGRII